MGHDEEPLPDWRAEFAREHGLRFSDPRAAIEASRLPEQDTSWVGELLREAGVVPAAERGLTAARLVKPMQAWSQATGYDPRMVPQSPEAYQAMIRRMYDRPRAQLAAALSGQPYLKAGYAVWREGDRRARLNVLYEVFDRVSAAMGPVFRFHPALMGYTESMGGMSGLYSEQFRKVMIAELVLDGDFTDLIDLIVHEQVHKLQHEMYLRTRWPSRWPLSLEERALVYYWVREEPRYRQLAAQGMADILAGRGNAAYRRIAREFHAYEVAEHVAEVVERTCRP